MSVLNINRNTSNPENNTSSPYTTSAPTTLLDWRIIVSVSFVFFVLWICALGITQWQCSASFVSPCYLFHLVFWLPLIGLSIFSLAFGFVLVQWAQNEAKKAKLANLMYQHYDPDNAELVLPYVSQIALQLAKSEHMRGLDTLTVTGSSGNSGGAKQELNINPLQDTPIILEEIFKHKED